MARGPISVSLTAKNPEQKELLRTISNNSITFVKGAPGTGKTFVAVGYALQELLKENYDYIIFSRPVVEAGGEKLGFLPGDLEDKIDPYMIPIFYSMEQMITGEQIKRLTNKNGSKPKVRILPMAYMRGVTFKNSCIVCDEMQNSTPEQVRMVLTRLGEGSKMILCGDVNQSDIHRTSGLEDAFELLGGIQGIGFCILSLEATVRHPIVKQVEARYEERKEKYEHKRN